MTARKPQILRGFIGLACVGIFSAYAFSFSGDALASRNPAPVPVQINMPTSMEFASSQRRLAKTTRSDPRADTCFRGQIMGGSEIHIAMNFAPLDRPATKQNPGLARVHATNTNGTDKVLVLESKDPTVWEVTGEPSAIILLGEAVMRNDPEGARIFAPRFASGCNGQSWVHLPKNWTLPSDQTLLESIADNVSSRFSKRAKVISTKMFNRPFSTWRVQRGVKAMKL